MDSVQCLVHGQSQEDLSQNISDLHRMNQVAVTLAAKVIIKV